MKKLFTLIALLATVVSGAWAKDVLVKSWIFTSIKANPVCDASIGTATINRAQCNYGTGAYEGLALQYANNSVWYGNTNGLRPSVSRNVAILGLKAADKVVITCTTADNIGNFVNMTEDPESTSATDFVYTLNVTADGNVGYTHTNKGKYIKSIEVYRDASNILLNEQWSIDFTKIASVSYNSTSSAFGSYTAYQLLSSGKVLNANFGVAASELKDGKTYNFFIYGGKLYAFYGGNRNIYFNNLEKAQYVKIVASIAPTSTDLEKIDALSEGDTYVFLVKKDGSAAVSIPRYTYISSVTVLSTKEVDGNRVGYTNMSSAENSVHSADITLAPGETLKYTFRNHGQEFGKNWRIFVKEGTTVKSITAADSYDYQIGAQTKKSYKVSKDNGATEEPLNWDEYKADMANATVEATLTYGVDGTLAIVTESKGDANGYIYYVDQDVTGLNGNLSINLSVNNSWLEILSTEVIPATVPVTISAAGYATFVTPYAVDFTDNAIEAYAVYAVNANTVTLKKVTQVPADEAVIVKGESGNVNVIASAKAIDNLMQVAINNVIYDENAEQINYVLAKPAGEAVGLYPVTSGTIAAGKGYLPVPNSVAVKGGFTFVTDDVTAANVVKAAPAAVKNGKFATAEGIVIVKDGVKYNVAGMKK